MLNRVIPNQRQPRGYCHLLAAIAILGPCSGLSARQGEANKSTLTLHARIREADGAGSHAVKEKVLDWDANKTALIVCDMWNQHWCQGATRRVGELASAMNETISAARDKGVLIIHAPSSCMDAYKDHPGRKRAQTAPRAAHLPPKIDDWCSKIPSEERGKYPIDQTDGGCDDGPRCPEGSPWKSQIAAIEIKEQDAISDSGSEIWNLLESRGITNVMLMGVHTNMCVLGRPFGLRNLARNGKNVVLVRDMTDTMYNSRKWPYVSHFEGTNKIVEHIEKFVAPTILSTDLTGRPAFRFQPDHRPRAVFLIGDDEYKTELTLPEFANSTLEPLGIRSTFVIADPRAPHDFNGAEALADADLLVLSVRRRAPTAAQMAIIRKYVESGKPLVGIRTACHAFDTRGNCPAGHAEWPELDSQILGGHYTGHHANGAAPEILAAVDSKAHAILKGVVTPFTATGSLYKTSPLSSGTQTLLTGTIPGQPPEPVAWINPRAGARVFYTSLGAPGDFKIPAFRALLVNAIHWAIEGASSTGNARAALPKTPALKDETHPFERGQGPLSPRAALATFTVPGDLRLETILSEPVVRQPVSIAFDERGRLWVVQYLQYPYPAGVKMLSHDKVWRAVYDKVPPPPPHHFPGKDKITIHEDSDGDGVFDRHKTFLDGLNIATAVAWGRGGVWVLNPPYLLFYPDRDRDDVPDGDPEVHLQGFGLEDTHSVVNSLRFGPDGWLYAAQGSTVTGHVTRPGLEKGKPPVHSMGQLIWRYHPETRRYEVFAEGGGNAFGVEIDRKGRIYSGHNGGDTRGFHYVQGGYFQKGFDKHGPLSNPYAFGYFPAMRHNRVPRFTHTFLIYDAELLPRRYHGLMFGVAPLLNHVTLSEVRPDGSSFQTSDVGLAVASSDPWFRPVDIKLGPDGAIYIADWYDRQVNHYRNHEGQIDPEHGRVYRLGAKANSTGDRPRPVDLTGLSTPELVSLLEDSNEWKRQTALRLIGDRHDASIAPGLKKTLLETTGQRSLETLWALNLVDGLDESTAMKALAHSDPYVRLWTARLLCDQNNVPPLIAAALVRRAAIEPDVEARAQLASSARRLPARDALPIVRALLAHDEDAADIHIPLLLWWAIEAKVATDPEAVLAMFEDKAIWNLAMTRGAITSRLMRRFAAAGSRIDLARCARLLAMAPAPVEIKRLMEGFEAAYAGRPLTGLPAELTDAIGQYSGQSLTLELRRGKPEAVKETISLLNDDNADRTRKIQLLQILGEVRQPAAVSVVLRLACESPDNALRASSLAALSPYDDPAIATAVLSSYANMSEDVRAAAQNLLAMRSSWAKQFLSAIESKAVDSRGVPREIIEKLSLLADSGISGRLSRIFGPIRPATSTEHHARIDRFARDIRAGSGVPKPGKQLFDQQCARCHTLFGKGGKVGPDLTTYRRDDVENMLLNIVNPSAEVREGYGTLVVATSDGRILTGVLVEQDQNVLTLRGSDGKEFSLSRAEVESSRPSPASLMPEGLLNDFTPQQIRDLFAYLRSTQPLID